MDLLTDATASLSSVRLEADTLGTKPLTVFTCCPTSPLSWTDALLRLVPGDVPRLDQVGLDGRVLDFTFAISLLLAVILGIVPLVRTGRADLRSALEAEGRPGTAGARRTRARTALVAAQVALAFVLLVGSGLLLRTFANLRDVDPGFDGSNTLTLRLSLSTSILRAAGRTEERGDDARSRFMIELTDRLASIPGVQRAAFSADLPLDGDEWHDFVATREAFPRGNSSAIKAARVFMGVGYLEAIGAELLRGRELDRQDFADQPRAVVVNESFAEQRWPGQDPVGRQVTQFWSDLNPEDDVWYTVVGVVRDIRETSLMTPPEPTVYLPTVFLPEGGFSMWVSNMVAVVRTEGDPMALLPRIRDEILDYRPDVPINNIETLDQLTARSFQDVSFAMVLILIAGGVSLVLGIVGIYGTVAYVVGQRTREFGIRLALGASTWNVRSDILGQGTGVALVGVAVGVVGALAAGRVLRSLLFDVSTSDPTVYAAVAGALLVVVIAASVIPAGRAAGVDPVVAMRGE